MIHREDVEKLSQLARIELTEAEKKKFQKELGSILDFVSQLKKAPVEKTKATGHALENFNVLREDRPEETKSGLADKLLRSAPSAEKGYVKVKPIFNNG